MIRWLAVWMVLLSAGAYAQPCQSPVPGVPCTNSMVFKDSALIGSGTANIMTLSPGVSASTQAQLQASGTAGIKNGTGEIPNIPHVYAAADGRQLQISEGTVSSGINANGSTFLVSRHQNFQNPDLCDRNATGDADCLSAITAISYSVGTDMGMASAIAGYALSSASGPRIGPGDTSGQGGTFIAESLAGSNRRALGLFAAGHVWSDDPASGALGAEITVRVHTQLGCGTDPEDDVHCTSLAVNARGPGFAPSVTVPTAIRVGANGPFVHFNTVLKGRFTSLDPAGSGQFLWDDTSSAAGVSYRIDGTHMHGIDMRNATITGRYLATPNIGLFATPQIVVGSLGAVSGTVFGSDHGLQLLSLATNTSAVLLGRWSDDAFGPNSRCYKSRGTTIGSHAIVQSGDIMCRFGGYGDDGVKDILVGRTSITAATGTIGVDRIPGQWTLDLNDTAGPSVLTTVLNATTSLVSIVPNMTITGQVRTNTGFNVSGAAGLTVVKTVRNSGGVGDCTLTFTGGILTASTCT